MPIGICYSFQVCLAVNTDMRVRIVGLEKIRLGWNQRIRQPLRDLLRECRYRKATDPRDKVYSLYGLMGDRMNNFLEPDYSKSVGQAGYIH